VSTAALVGPALRCGINFGGFTFALSTLPWTSMVEDRDERDVVREAAKNANLTDVSCLQSSGDRAPASNGHVQLPRCDRRGLLLW
jgi:hypothetical protein